jgi:hypothetical protein
MLEPITDNDTMNLDPCGHCFEECNLGTFHYPCPCIKAGKTVCN